MPARRRRTRQFGSACFPEKAQSDRLAEPTITRRCPSFSSRYILACAIASFTTRKLALPSAILATICYFFLSSRPITAVMSSAESTFWQAEISLKSVNNAFVSEHAINGIESIQHPHGHRHPFAPPGGVSPKKDREDIGITNG